MKFEIGDRVRLKENFNNLKATQLLEIKKLKEDKNEYVVFDIQNYGTHTVKENQLEEELA